MHSTDPGSQRVAIYARYSSQLQKPTSIEDQVRLCRQQAAAHGHDVVCVHIDRSATATTRHSRPGLRDLLRDAERRIIDFVYAEALDRLSRDQEDMPGIYKRLKYWNVQLFTLEEGDIQPIHIFVGGFMNHAWIENLANKTRRGQIGAVHAGRIPGGLCYGYRTANRIDENGRPVRGLREVDPHEAAVVRRIYGLYADGSSAREIAGILNGEGEPGPRGRAWGQSTINGHRTRRNGILNNELYRGRIVYGRQNFIRDPDTGRRQARPVDPSKWVVQDVPELRIVDDTLWNLVQTRRQAGAFVEQQGQADAHEAARALRKRSVCRRSASVGTNLQLVPEPVGRIGPRGRNAGDGRGAKDSGGRRRKHLPRDTRRHGEISLVMTGAYWGDGLGNGADRLVAPASGRRRHRRARAPNPASSAGSTVQGPPALPRIAAIPRAWRICA